jgi:hypothetical protein
MNPAGPIVDLSTSPDERSVATIAALQAISVATMRTGAIIWVATKKAPYYYDGAAATVAGDGNFYVAPTSGAGMYVRQLLPVPEWRAKATDGTGIFIDPTSGSDEGVGSVGTPIKTMAEFCARMWGAEFSVTSPLLTVIGTGSAIAQDKLVTGFRCAGTAPLIVAGVPTVVQAGVLLSAALDLNVAVSSGLLESVATNFGASGFVSTAARSLFARRANLAGGQTTFASLYRTHGAGPFQVDICPQYQQNLVTYSMPALTTQAFAVGDIVDLVSYPVWPGFEADKTINLAYALLDIASGSTLIGNIQSRNAGTRGLCTVGPGSSINHFGGQITGGWTVNQASVMSVRFMELGAQGVATIFNVNGTFTISGNFTMDNARIIGNGTGPSITGINNTGARGWVQNLPITFFDGGFGGSCFLPVGVLVGVGAAVPSGGICGSGSQMRGAATFLATNPFSTATPWTVAGVGYATAALGIFDANTMSAIVL